MQTRSIFLRFIISYLGLIFIFLVIGLVTYNGVVDIFYVEIIAFQQTEIRNNIEDIDIRLNEIKNVIDIISLSPEMNALYLLKKPIETKDYFKLIQFHEQIKLYSLTNEFIKNLVVYFRPSESIVTSSHIDVNVAKYYENFLKHGDLTYEQWFQLNLEEEKKSHFIPEQSISSDQGEYKAIQYVEYLPGNTSHRRKAIVMSYIDVNSLIDHFHVNEYEGSFLIINHDGKLIAKSDNIDDPSVFNDLDFQNNVGSINYSGKPFLVFRGVSKENNIEYIYGLSVKVISRDLENVRNISIIALSVLVFLGLLSSMYFSYRNSRPIKQIMERIMKASNEGAKKSNENEYDYIRGTISQLISDNKDLKSHLEDQKPLMQMGFFEKLFKGGYLRKDELISIAGQLNIEFPMDLYYVAIIRIGGTFGSEFNSDLDDLQVALFSARNYSQICYGESIHQYIFDNDKLAVIIGCEDKEKLYGNSVDLVTRLNTEMGIPVKVGLSNGYDNPIELSLAFEEALSAIEYRVTTLEKVRWFRDIPQIKEGYYYPLEEEMKLINLLKSGLKEEAVNVFNGIYSKNFIEAKLVKNEIDQLLWEVRGTFMKLLNHLYLSNERKNYFSELITKISSQKSISNIFEFIHQFIEEITDDVNHGKEQENMVLIEEIRAFIEVNYNDYDLSLTYVAEEFELTEKYLSSFFKEFSKENFTNYILKIRMGKAVRLLAEGLPVADIAKRVGYRNTNTFFRAFKRVYSVSPSTYKKENEL